MIKKITVSPLDKEKLQTIQIDPTTQMDDHFDYSKVVVKKPWGYEYLMYQNELVAVWILFIKEGFQTSKHCHPNKKTSLIVLSGEVDCSLLNETIRRKAGEGLFLDKGVFHSTKTISPNGAFVMETETPNNKRDLVRLEDKYGRVGKGYETVKEMSYNLQNYNYISFIDPKIYYNTTKKFGSCSLTISQFTKAKNFFEDFKSKGWDAVTFLKGTITGSDGKVLLEPGDTVDMETFSSFCHEKIQNNGTIEVMAVKKKDTLIKLSDYVFSFLENEGVKDIFFVPGSSNVHLLDSLGRNTNLRHIRTQTESACAMAAESYAKLTNQCAVVVLPSGASATNALTGVADAWIDSTPLLVLSGQARTDETVQATSLRQLGIQELNIVPLVKSITKYAVMIEDPQSIKYHLQKAICLAKEGRYGPVWIDLPIDIQGTVIDEEELPSFQVENVESKDFKELKEKVAETLKLLRNSKRPVLLVGNGIRLARAENELLKLIEALSIPVLCSRRGADLIPEEEPLFFGRPGAYGLRSANFVVQNSDLLLSIGCRLSLPQIGRNYKAFARQAKVIVVDIDRAELEKKTLSPYLSIHSSAKNFLQEMLAQISQSKESPVSRKSLANWIQRCALWKSNYSFSSSLPSHKVHPAESQKVNAYDFVRVLSNQLKEGAILAVDGGAPMIFFMQVFRFKSGQRLISATGLENTSFALPAAIGCCVAENGREVICVCEDDGFQKNIQELKTIVRYALPVKIFILNTGGCPTLIRETQRDYFGSRFIATQTEEGTASTDIFEICQSYKLTTVKIDKNAELEEQIRKVLSRREACLCVVNIDKEQKVEPKMVFTVKPDGKWISKPLEDMYPFLSREELKSQMLIDLMEEE